jgi:hypothetical protein
VQMTTLGIRRALWRLRASLHEAWMLANGRRILRRARRRSRKISVEDPAPSAERPILLIVDDADPFGRYLAEILRCEGFAAFGVLDRTGLTEDLVSNKDLVVLAPMCVSQIELAVLDRFVREGGCLLAIRPDAALGPILGLRSVGASLPSGYVHIGANVPWSGSSQPLRIDAPADLFELAGATGLASMSGRWDGGQHHVAVSLRSMGQGGGRAAALTFDLARAVVHARQGNPSWIVTGRRNGPTRAVELFIDPASPGRLAWADDDRLEVPRADELQRLLANMIIHLTSERRPAPRLWYFPGSESALLVLTGDDHGKADVGSRFERLKAFDDPVPEGVGDGVGTLRATTYLWPDEQRRDAAPQLSNEEGTAYHTQGFEIALHPNAGRDDHRPEKLAYHLDRSLRIWRSRYPSLPSPTTVRWHCVAWAGWIEPPLLERVHGIRLDLNYYFFPPEVVRDRSACFTGSAMPMRFADLDGRPIDVFQLCTPLTDESGQSYPEAVETLLDRARGEEGFYGAFAANIHTTPDEDDRILEGVIEAARVRGVPVISARRLLEWIDARQASSCEVVGWAERTLVLSVRVPPTAAGRLTLLIPADRAGGPQSVTKAGTPVPFRRHVVKGIDYIAFEPISGTYEVAYRDHGEATTSLTEEEALR